MKNKITLLAALLMSASAAYAVNSDPDTLFLWDGNSANNQTIKDGGAGDANGAAGAVTFVGGIGSWSIIVDTGTTKPANLSTPANPLLDLSFDHVASSGPATLGVAFFDDNFNPANLGAALSHIGGTLPANVALTYTTFVNTANLTPTFSGGTLNVVDGVGNWVKLSSHTFIGAGGGAGNSFGADDVGGIISGGSSEYSLLVEVTAKTTTANSFSGNANLHTVPDGGTTMLLLGSGLTALALLRRSLK